VTQLETIQSELDELINRNTDILEVVPDDKATKALLFLHVISMMLDEPPQVQDVFGEMLTKFTRAAGRAGQINLA
jgi:hypothetical protein